MIGTTLISVIALGAGAHMGPDYEIGWWTIDGGGGTSTGGSFVLSGTAGQHDAGGVMSGGSFELVGGFWAGVTAGGGCFADFNGDGTLNILDFVAFQGAFVNGDGSADCDGNGSLNVLDFVCFQGAFQAGC